VGGDGGVRRGAKGKSGREGEREGKRKGRKSVPGAGKQKITTSPLITTPVSIYLSSSIYWLKISDIFDVIIFRVTKFQAHRPDRARI